MKSKQTQEQTIPSSNLTAEMDPADRALVQSFVEKYGKTGIPFSKNDRATMIELARKYSIRVNTNPPTIRSRHARVHRNPCTDDGTPIPFRRAEDSEEKLSKGALKKFKAKARKAQNRARH